MNAQDRKAAEQFVAELVAIASPPENASRDQEIRYRGFLKFTPLAQIHQVTWVLELMDQEKKLLELGEAATGPISAALRDERVCDELRARFALLLGRIRSRSALEVLFGTIEKSGSPLVRESCLHAVGLIGSAESVGPLRLLFGTDRAPLKPLMWAMAMCGSKPMMEEYLRLAESLLGAERVDDVGSELGLKELDWAPGGNHLMLLARESPLNKDLYFDMWRLAHIRDRRVLGLLVKGLRYHEPRVQHMAWHFLDECVADGTGTEEAGAFEYDLHSLATYSKWTKWWSENESRVVWDPTSSKYRARKP